LIGYEYQLIRVPRGVKKSAVHKMLTEFAERERWILDRVRIYPDGRHVVQLKRKIWRQESENVSEALPPV
jgi:ribosomal protein L13